MTTTDTLAGLLRRCLADFDEDAPRLVLADMLRERGDDDRADFITAQIGLANWKGNDHRWSSITRLNWARCENNMLMRYGLTWLPPALMELESHAVGRVVEYRRGFPAGLRGKRPINLNAAVGCRWTMLRPPAGDARAWALPGAVWMRLLPDPKCVRSSDGSNLWFRDYATEADAVRGLALAMMRLTVAHLLGEQS